METAELAETARKALDILDRDGWNKGSLTMHPELQWAMERLGIDAHLWRAGSHCIGGAWNLALHGTDVWRREHDSYGKIADVIIAQHPGWRPQHCWRSDVGFIAEWNNHESTTEDDVRAVLEKIAAG